MGGPDASSHLVTDSPSRRRQPVAFSYLSAGSSAVFPHTDAKPRKPTLGPRNSRAPVGRICRPRRHEGVQSATGGRSVRRPRVRTGTKRRIFYYLPICRADRTKYACLRLSTKSAHTTRRRRMTDGGHENSCPDLYDCPVRHGVRGRSYTCSRG